jgi:hypothetical protein
MASVSDEIRRLRFVSSPAPAVYLNEVLVRETFIAHLGAIDSFTRSANPRVPRRSGLRRHGRRLADQRGADRIRLDGPHNSGLVLHSALRADGQVGRPQLGTSVGNFVEAVGSAYFPSLSQPEPTPPRFADAAQVIQAELYMRAYL